MADCSTELCPQGYRQVTLWRECNCCSCVLTDKVDYFTRGNKICLRYQRQYFSDTVWLSFSLDIYFPFEIQIVKSNHFYLATFWKRFFSSAFALFDMVDESQALIGCMVTWMSTKAQRIKKMWIHHPMAPIETFKKEVWSHFNYSFKKPQTLT